MVLKLGIPKGSLQESTIKIFKETGYNTKVRERNYYPCVIPKLRAHGAKSIVALPVGKIID